MHATDVLAYFNVSEVPGSALATAVARELAARLFGKPGGGLGEVLLPGATGPEILFAIGRHLAETGNTATLVIDNAHMVAPTDLRALIELSPHLRFILLAQPGPNVALIEATLGIAAEPLRGWTNETIAAEGSERGCHGDYQAYERLLGLTAGLPLYVQNALQISAQAYQGSVSRFGNALEAQTHTVATAQELILAQVFDTYNSDEKCLIGALSLVDVPLRQDEAAKILRNAFGNSDAAVAAVFRKLRLTGALQVFGVDRLKVHDAMRLLGRAHLETLGGNVARKARIAIRDLLIRSLPRGWDMQKVFLLLRMFVALGNSKPLVQLATDELFHEMSYMPEIAGYLEKAAASEDMSAEDRFWALDGLVFGEFRQGEDERIPDRLKLMERLVAENDLGPSERLAVCMKRMIYQARKGDADAVSSSMEQIMRALPDRPDFVRIARYNFAHALYELGRYDACLRQTCQLIDEYYEVLGLTPRDVIGKIRTKSGRCSKREKIIPMT